MDLTGRRKPNRIRFYKRWGRVATTPSAEGFALMEQGSLFSNMGKDGGNMATFGRWDG